MKMNERTAIHALFASFLLLGLLAAGANAAGPDDRQHPDLSGVWVLDQQQSEIPEAVRGGGGGRGAGAWAGYMAPEMAIKHTGGSITFDRKRSGAPLGRRGARRQAALPGPQTVAIDGKPHPQRTGRGEATVTATWEGDRLVVEQEWGGGPDSGGFSATTVYQLSEDGERLILEVTTSRTPATPTYHLVYLRKDG